MRFDEYNDLYKDDAIPLKRRTKKPGPDTAAADRRNVRPSSAGKSAAPVRQPQNRPYGAQPVSRQPASRPANTASANRSSNAAAAKQRTIQSGSQYPSGVRTQNAHARQQYAAGRTTSSPQVSSRVQGRPQHASRDRNKTYSTGKFTIPEQLRNNAAQNRGTVRQAPVTQRQGAPRRNQNDIPVAIPVRGQTATRRSLKNGYAGEKKKSGAFKKGFLIYLGVLLALAIVFLIYVHGLLVDFEASQIDNVVSAKLEDIKKAASRGRIESEISLDAIKEKYSPSDAELEDYEKAFALGDLTYKKSRSGLNAETETYAIFLNGFHMGNMELKNVREDTVLAIFPITEWEIVGCGAETFSFDFPSSVTISSGGKTVEGKPSETEGLYSYPVSSLFSEDTVIIDSAGNTVSFNGKDPVSFVNYTVKALSTYNVYYGDKMIDPAKAEKEEIEAYKYVKEYCDSVPDLSVYRLCLIDNGGKISIKDAAGADVEFKQNESHIEAKELAKSDEMPTGLSGQPNPLEAAEKLNLFTSDDLGGVYPHGFYNLAPYLLEGSYFYDKYWEFATSIDITFTSGHTLDNPIFNSEKVSEFVKFSDECFSCRIEFNKPMHMDNGVYKVDEVNGIYYFVYADDSDDGVDNPHWGIVDNSDVAKQIN